MINISNINYKKKWFIYLLFMWNFDAVEFLWNFFWKLDHSQSFPGLDLISLKSKSHNSRIAAYGDQAFFTLPSFVVKKARDFWDTRKANPQVRTCTWKGFAIGASKLDSVPWTNIKLVVDLLLRLLLGKLYIVRLRRGYFTYFTKQQHR